MKKLFLCVALFAWIGFSASAQVEKQDTKKHDPEDQSTKMGQNEPYWIFKDGKVMEMRDGNAKEMLEETQVGEVWIRANGDVVLKDNSIVRLKAGEYLDKKGEILKMSDKEKPSNKKPSERKMPMPVMELN